MKKDLIATYQSLMAFYNQPSTTWLTLAEFIDNSISSFQGKGNYNNSLKDLKIEIIYDMSQPSNHKIIINDNAKGMDEEELVNAMQPFNVEGKSGNDYNQYGVGMKFGCFYNGRDAKIYSKKEGQNEYFVEIKTSDKKGGEPAYVESKISIENKIKTPSGTCIIIENLYQNRKITNNEKRNEIKQALGWRYNKLISELGLKIIFSTKTSDQHFYNINDVTIEAYHNKPFNFNKFLEYKKDSIDNFDFFKNECISSVKKIINDENKQNQKILIEFCKKILNNEDLNLNLAINVNNNSENQDYNKYFIGTDEELNELIKQKKFNCLLNVGILASYENKNSLSKNSGVTTYHIKRAINHGPNSRNAIDGGNISFKNGKSNIGSGGDPTWRRLYGEIDLTGIEIPDQNKSRFNWSAQGKDDLENVLACIFTQTKDLLNLMIKWEENKKANSYHTKKEINEIVNYTTSLIDENLIKPKVINNLENNVNNCNVVYEIEGSNTKINVIETSLDSASNYDLIRVSEADLECIRIYVNVNAPIWKPFITNEKENVLFRGKLVYPIILLLAIVNSYLNNDDDIKNFLNIDESIFKKDKLINVLNLVFNKIKSRNTNEQN